ncbi:hypothetical protein ABFC64_08890 [Microbacterium rhizosphaerae]|uniref:hypothetical protein n=1 Tax=Microbacterium rhizosphaerae TaxID=1678237 RepID=UPI0032181889
MSDTDDDTLARRRGEEATVVSHRPRPGAAEPPASEGTEASVTEDETVVRPRPSPRASVAERPAVPPSTPRRRASSGQPENTVYRPRPPDPAIVPRPGS